MSESTNKEITRPVEKKKNPMKTVLWLLFLVILGVLVGFSIANTKPKSTEEETETVSEVAEDTSVELSEEEQGENATMFMMLGGGLIIIIAVVVTVVSSTVSSVASAVDDEEDE